MKGKKKKSFDSSYVLLGSILSRKGHEPSSSRKLPCGHHRYSTWIRIFRPSNVTCKCYEVEIGRLVGGLNESKTVHEPKTQGQLPNTTCLAWWVYIFDSESCPSIACVLLDHAINSILGIHSLDHVINPTLLPPLFHYIYTQLPCIWNGTA